MRRKILWVLLISALTVNLVIGYRVYSKEARPENEIAALEKLSIMMRVLHLIQKDYVAPERVDYEQLIYHALEGMVSSLDPYSSFMEPRDYDRMMEVTEGHFGGLGVVVTVQNGRLTVVTPIEGTPGARAGIMAGDQIVEIEGESVEMIALDDAVGKLKGEPGTSVSMKIYRPDTEETISLTIERAVIEVASVKNAQLLKDAVGYVRVTQFDEGTAESLRNALQDLRKEGMRALIMDLRNNPGGLLNSAVDICGFFLDKKNLVVSTEGRQPSQNREYRTSNGGDFQGLPMVILVNKGSASAAEIVAGCLKDLKRAVLIGEKTFGKGSVQNVIGLPDGSALRLTTAHYYTPSRNVIHEQGVQPDIEVKLSPEEMRMLAEAQLQYNGRKELAVEADPQLRRALEDLTSYEVFKRTDER